MDIRIEYPVAYDGQTPMPKSLKIALDVLLIAVPLVVMMFFLTHPDAFDAFLDWMMKTL